MKKQKTKWIKKILIPAFFALTLALSACAPAANSNSESSSSNPINLNSSQNNGIILKHQDAHEFLAVPTNKKLITEISNKYLANFSSFIGLTKVTSATEDLTLNTNITGNFLKFNDALGVKSPPAASTSSSETSPAEPDNVIVKGLKSNLSTATNLEYLVEKLSSNTTSTTEGAKSDFALLETNLSEKQKKVKENLKSIKSKLSTFPNISIKNDVAIIEKAMTDVATKSKSLPTIINNLTTDARKFVSNIIQTTTNSDGTTSYKLSNVTGVKLFNFVNKVKTALTIQDFSASNDQKNYQSFKSAYNESLTIFNQVSSELDGAGNKLINHLNQVIDYLNSYKILQDYLNDSTKVNSNLSLGFIIASSSTKSDESSSLENFKIPINNYIKAAEAFLSNPVGLMFFDRTNSNFKGIIYNSGFSQLGIAIKSLNNDIQRFKNNGKTLLFNLNLLANDEGTISKFEEILNTAVKDDYQKINNAFLSPQNGVETIMKTIKFNAEEIQKYYKLNFARYFDLKSNDSITKVMQDLENLVNTYNSTKTNASMKITNFSNLKNSWKKVSGFFEKAVAFSNQILGDNKSSTTNDNFVKWTEILKKLQNQSDLGNFDIFNVLEFIKNIEDFTTSFNATISNNLTITKFTDLMGFSNVFNVNHHNGLHLILLVFQNELSTKKVDDTALKNKFKELFVSVDNDSTSLITKLVKGFPVVRNGVGVETNSIEKTRLSYFIQLDANLKLSLSSFKNKTLKSFPPNDTYSSISQTLSSWLRIANN